MAALFLTVAGSRIDLGQASGDDRINRGVKYQSNVRSGNLDIHIGIARPARLPVDDPVISRVDCGLLYGWGHGAAQMIQEIAGTAVGVAGGPYFRAVLLQDMPANNLRRATDRIVVNVSTERRCQGNNGSDVIRPLTRYRAGNNTAKTVADEIYLPAGLADSSIDDRIQVILNKQVRTLGIDGDTRAI